MVKELSFLLLIVFLGSFLFLPLISLADGSYQTTDGRTVNYKGFVPCGKSIVAPGESQLVTEDCQLCHLFVMINGILKFIIWTIVPLIATLLFIIGGIMFFFAGASPEKLDTAKKILTSTVIGLVIIFASYLIVGAVLDAVGVASGTPLYDWIDKGSFIINCPISL